jgi:hypothetical protein
LDSSSAYYGEGTYLRNIPRNALSDDALISTEIKSGSVTASVSPDKGFVVKSLEFGAYFSGSITSSGNIQVQSGSFFSGSGQGLFNIPLSALNIDSLVAARIASGSVTASVSPNFGFRVESFQSGSQFTGSLFVSGARGIEIVSGSSYSGSGERLFNIPISALKDLDLSRIKSGSVTASISPDKGFVVNTFSTFSGSMIITASATYYPS